MADPNIAAMQSAANRYAQIANFSPIAVDGIMGSQTQSAVISALQEIYADVDGESDTASTLIATTDQSTLTSSASGFAQYLNQNADYLNLPAAAQMTVASGPRTLSPTSSIPGSSMASSLSVTWNSLPMTVKVGAGLLAFAGIAAAGTHYLKKHPHKRR